MRHLHEWIVLQVSRFCAAPSDLPALRPICCCFHFRYLCQFHRLFLRGGCLIADWTPLGDVTFV